MEKKKFPAKLKAIKKAKKNGYTLKSRSKESKLKKKEVKSKKDLTEKEEKWSSKKTLPSQNKKFNSFDENIEESSQNLSSFFGKIFSIFKKNKFRRDFKNEELEDARKRLESELGKKLKYIRLRNYSKNPLNFDKEYEDEKKRKIINKGSLFLNLKRNSLGQIFSSLNPKNKKLVKEKISFLNFSTYLEFENSLVLIISDILMDSYTEISDKIINLIKSGGEAGKLELESMEIPLKINLFKATKSKKDFKKIEDMIKKINSEFLKMEKFSEKEKKKSIYFRLKKQSKVHLKKRQNTRAKKNYNKNLKNEKPKKKKTNLKKKFTKKQRHSKTK